LRPSSDSKLIGPAATAPIRTSTYHDDQAQEMR
jgi:hypothetical protein